MMARTDRELRGKQIEVLGREFSLVREGLDPNEVVDFLEAVAGSSEAAFRRLEQFSAFQTFARSMGDSIGEARALADHAKSQVRVEAQRQKQEASEELKRQVGTILDRARSSCIASIDETYTALLEALTEAQEMERTAFERAKETVSKNLVTVHQDIRDMMEKHLSELSDGLRESEPAKPAPAKAQPAPLPAVASPAAPARAADIAGIPHLAESRQPAGDRPSTASGMRQMMGSLLDVETVRLEPREGEQYSSGSVAIVVPEDADALWIRQLRQRMLVTPGVHILRETGGDDRALSIDLHLDEPMELISMLQRMPNVKGVVKSHPGNGANRQGGQGEDEDPARPTVLTMVLR